MGLTASVELELRNVGLLEFYEKNEAAFTDMFNECKSHIDRYVAVAGIPVRRDDVAESLVPALTVTETVRDFLADKKLRQKYWYQHLADLICDRLWQTEEATNEQAPRN